MALHVETRQTEAGIVVLEISGRLVFSEEAGCAYIKTTVENLVQQDRKMVIFDLTSVTSIDSAAVGLIVYCGMVLKRSRRRLGVAANERVKQFLFFTHIPSLGLLIDLHGTVAEVLRAFGAVEG